MRYDIVAYLLAFSGQVEAPNKEEAEKQVRKACNYPLNAPIIINFVDEAKVENN